MLASTTPDARLRQVLTVIQNYLPPDGGTADEALNKIIELVDPWPAFPSDPSTYQDRATAWCKECVGEDAYLIKVRCHRFLEEALELVQALGSSKAAAHRLVEYVYSRPAGEVEQEIGGTVTTLAVLCSAAGCDMLQAGEKEYKRVNTPEMIAKIRAKHNSKPDMDDNPLPVAVGNIEPNNDEVICPNCTTQFRAIPVNVQAMLIESDYEPPFTSTPPRLYPVSVLREALARSKLVPLPYRNEIASEFEHLWHMHKARLPANDVKSYLRYVAQREALSCAGLYSYAPTSLEEAVNFEPHEWVLNAMATAVHELGRVPQ